MADIATLGLQIDNAQAVAAAQQTGAALDQLGVKGEAASAKVASSMKRTIGSTEGLNAAQQQLQVRLDALTAATSTADLANKEYVATLRAQIASISTVMTAMRGSEAQFAQLAAATAALTVTTKAATAAHVEMGAATMGFGDKLRSTSGRLGRLTYSFGALSSRMLGLSPIMGRAGAVMGNLFAGAGPTIAVMTGIAALGGLYEMLTAKAKAAAEAVAAAVRKIDDAMARNASTNNTQALTDQLQAIERGKQFVIGAVTGKVVQTYSESHYAPGNFVGGAADLRARLAALETAKSNTSPLNLVQMGDIVKHIKDITAQLTPLTRAEKHIEYAIENTVPLRETKNKAIEIKAHSDALTALTAHAARAVHAPKIPDVRSAVVISTVDHFAAQYNQLVREADNRAKGIGKSSMSGVKGDLLAGGGQLQNIVDHAKVLEALGPSKELDRVRAAAEKMGKAEITELAKSNRGWAEKAQLIAEVKRQMAGLGTPQDWSKMSTSDKIASSMRSGADAANLFGGPRGAQWGNILNTAANAATNTASAIAQGGTNPIADAQAALSIASLGKQIFGLGSQSHATKDRINEANQALKNTMSIESDIINHNPLQAMLDQVKQAYDQQYASINNTLPGLKNQTQRNIDLTAATAMYNQQLALTQAQFTLQTSNFSLSMTARMDAAKGLTFDAAKLNMKISQATEMANIQNTYGKDSIQAQTLAMVQNTEMLRLVNQSLTQVANAPTGFFAENYASSYVTRQAAPTSGGSTSGGGITFNAPVTISLPISTSTDPVTHAKEVVKGIRQFGNATGGINVPVAQTMELM